MGIYGGNIGIHDGNMGLHGCTRGFHGGNWGVKVLTCVCMLTLLWMVLSGLRSYIVVTKYQYIGILNTMELTYFYLFDLESKVKIKPNIIL